MSDPSTPEEPPEQTEVYEQYDEVAEDGSTGTSEDPGATGVTGAEEDLTRFTEMPVDEAANEEIGANLDDPDGDAPVDVEAEGWNLDAGERP